MPGNRHRSSQRLARLCEFSDHAPLSGFLAGEFVAGKQQLLGAAHAGAAHQVLDAAAAGHDAAFDFSQGKSRRLRRNDEISHQGQFKPAAMRMAFNCRNHGQREILDRKEGLFNKLVLLAPGVIAHAIALFQVTTRRKGTRAFAGDQQHAKAVVMGKLVQGLLQVNKHLRVH